MNSRRFDDETLTSSLQLLAEEMESLSAPPEIEKKLREAFRAQTATAASHRYGRYWLVAVAAMILIVISVIALRSRTDPPKQNIAQQPQMKEQLVREEPKAVVDQSSPKQQIAHTPRRRAVRRTPNSEVANHVTREIATDFMPLGYLNASTLQEGGQIVRVELPRSTLASFGLPVNMDRYHERVKADVFIGVDGLAHAIRFVK
jgi:hypothetical protein